MTQAQKNEAVNDCIRNVWMHVPFVLAAVALVGILVGRDTASTILAVFLAVGVVGSMARQMYLPYKIVDLATD